MMTRRTIGCGLCPLRITLYGELLRWWFCPLCGCFNTIPIGAGPPPPPPARCSPPRPEVSERTPG